MTQKALLELTVEELNMILLCTARNKNDIIIELESYLDTSDPDMAEIIHSTIEKTYNLTEEEFKIIFMR